MCTNASKTAASLMAAIEPTLKSLLSYTGLLTTPQGAAAIAAYEAAMTALEGWQSGTAAADILELMADFQTVFNAVPWPPGVSMLVNIILAGAEAVIGVLTANSPAPAGQGDATREETQAMHQAEVARETAAKVAALVPGFKRSIWHSPATQYKTAWNHAVALADLPASLKTS